MKTPSAAPRPIELAELVDRLGESSRLELWNVLTDDYFTGELIPGSRRVPLDTVVRTARSEGRAREAEWVVYCSGPDCPQSRLAAEKLAAAGYSNVRSFEGGLAAWKQSGRPVVAVSTAAA
jgi:rhodanese-related sulfurtransferase